MNKMFLKTILSAVLTMSAVLVLVAAPKSEAQFDRLVKTYTLNPDGSQEFRVQKQLTIYTHAAMNSLYGETFIVYDPSYQELKINDSYTRQADGTIVRTPENAFVEVLPSAAANAPAYNGLKEMVVVHTGLELGATIYLDYTLITKAGALPALDVFETVEELSPIREYVLSVSVPEGTPLHYELLNGKARPSVTSADGMQTVKWTLRNVKPRPRSLEVSVPAGSIQAIAANTYASRKDALDVLASQAYSPDDEAVKALLESFNAGPADRRSTIDKIHEYLKSRLAGCSLTLQQTAYRLRSASEVIAGAYATEAEKAFLASALLNAIGMQSEVELAFPKTSDPASAGLASVMDIMALGYFNTGDKITKEIGGYLAIVGLDGQPVELPSPVRKYRSNMTLAVNPDDIKPLDGGLLVFELPEDQPGWFSHVYPLTATNTTSPVNLLLPYLAEASYVCRLEPGEGVKPVVLPENLSLSNRVGSLTVSVTEEDGRIVISRQLKITLQLITPDLYSQYYRLMSEWYTVSPLVFKAE